MKVVAALGGNALLERGEAPDSDIQESHVARAAAALSPLLRDHDLIITHGNGPQVGVLAVESAGDPSLSHPYPFDVLGAQTQGMIGYWLMQALDSAAAHAAAGRGAAEHGSAHGGRRAKPAACLICRTLVKADDPAFAAPTKFVGPVYDQATASRLAAGHGWEIRPDGHSLAAGRALTRAGRADRAGHDQAAGRPRRHRHLRRRWRCPGGGRRRGRAPRGRGRRGQGPDRGAAGPGGRRGRTAAAHRRPGGAGRLRDGACPAPRQGDPGRAAAPPGRPVPAGSMGPKVEAACRFAAATGGMAAIGRLDDAQALLEGQAGTIVQTGAS